MSGPESISPRCPRCGYDLSGHTESWASACEIEGRCSECGLAFWWSDVFAPLWVGPRWSFEHQRVRTLDEHTARRVLLLRLVQTMLMAFRPRKLWREMMVIHKFNARRLGGLAAASLAVLHALCAILVIGSERIFDGWAEPSRWVILFPYGEMVTIDCGAAGGTALPLWAPLSFAGVSLSMPLSMLVLRTSFKRARVRRAHLVRTGVLSRLYGDPSGGARTAHLVRAGVLSLPLISATVLAMLGLVVLVGCSNLLGTGVVQYIQMWGPPAGFLAILVGYGIWWRAFLGEYVHMPQPTPTTIVLMVLSCVFVFVTVFVISVWSL